MERCRNHSDFTGTLEGRIVDNIAELKQNIFGQGFGGITDIEVGPDGYLYILSLYKGGDNCPSAISEKKNCINYDSELQGTIFRIVRR